MIISRFILICCLLYAPHALTQIEPCPSTLQEDLCLLDRACKKGDLTTLYALLSKYATSSINIVTLPSPLSQLRNTPLHIAAYYNQMLVLRQLLASGAPIDAQNRLGTTALHIATQKGYEAIANYLLDMSASYTLKDLCNKTALDVAQASGFPKIQASIREHQADDQPRKNSTSPYVILSTILTALLLHSAQL